MSAPSKLAIAGRIDARVAAYAVLAGVALGGAAAAKADIVNSGPVNINIPSTTSGVYLNIVTGVFAATPSEVPGWDLNLWSTSTLEIWANNSNSPDSGVIDNFTGGTAGSVDNLPGNVTIDNSWNYGRTDATVETSGPTAFVLNSTNNLFGFHFLNESTGQYDFGAARISLSGSLSAQPRMIVDYLYENNGTPIFFLPEPPPSALLSLFAVGAFGIRAWRKRRRR
ncbi:MAG: hypothetical protein ACRD5Z_10850 [Bryobacteraceae bacterium]